MRLSKKIVVLMLLLYTAVYSLSAQTTSQLSEKYNSQLEAYLSGSVERRIIDDNLEKITADIAGNNDFESIYLRSKTFLLKGIILAKLDDEEGSINALELSQNDAEKALKLKNNSDCWRILGEAGSAIMLQKGVSYIIANGGKVEEYIDQSIALDAQNTRAQVLKAQSLINKPFIFGGSVKKGVKLLEELKSQNRGTKADRFFVLYNLSLGYQKQKKDNNAIESCREALALYPANWEAAELLAELIN